MIDKEGALRIIIRDARSARTSKSSYQRVLRALKTLELDALQTDAILRELDYLRPDGTPITFPARASYLLARKVTT